MRRSCQNKGENTVFGPNFIWTSWFVQKTQQYKKLLIQPIQLNLQHCGISSKLVLPKSPKTLTLHLMVKLRRRCGTQYIMSSQLYVNHFKLSSFKKKNGKPPWHEEHSVYGDDEYYAGRRGLEKCRKRSFTFARAFDNPMRTVCSSRGTSISAKTCMILITHAWFGCARDHNAVSSCINHIFQIRIILSTFSIEDFLLDHNEGTEGEFL